MKIRPLAALLIAFLTMASVSRQDAPSIATVSLDEAAAWAEKTMAGMTLERKIAQLVCSDIAGGYIADDDQRLARWVALARDYGLGMFVVYGGTPRDVARLLNRLQKEAAIPLLISADFEGGPGQQVAGASEYPANMGFAAAGSGDLVYRAAAAAAIEGRAMGIHLTYTPVSDIAWRPENPAEGVRSFGGDFDLMGRLLEAYVRGYHDNGMLTTAKHFPGRGDVEAMPDSPGWTWINKPAEVVEAQEFRAFKLAIEAGVDFVMTEHIAVPSVTGGSMLPASVEKALATDWLRGKLGFRGVLTSDDLWYDNVVARFGAEEVAIRALEAGHDIILKPKDPVATIAAVAAAVRSGRLSEERIDASVFKLLVLKARLGLGENRFVDEASVGASVGTPEHAALVQEIADRSLTLLKNDGVLPLPSGPDVEHRQHQRPENRRRSRARGPGRETDRRFSRLAKLHPAAGSRSGLLRSNPAGRRRSRRGPSVAFCPPEPSRRRDTVPAGRFSLSQRNHCGQTQGRGGHGVWKSSSHPEDSGRRRVPHRIRREGLVRKPGRLFRFVYQSAQGRVETPRAAPHPHQRSLSDRERSGILKDYFFIRKT